MQDFLNKAWAFLQNAWAWLPEWAQFAITICGIILAVILFVKICRGIMRLVTKQNRKRR